MAVYLTRSMHEALKQTPDGVATICGDRTRTWRESADRIARLAGALKALGVAEGDRVGILSLNSDRYHEFMLAVWWAGAVVNPVNTRWSAKEIAYSLEDSGTHVLFADDEFVPLVPRLREEWEGVTTLVHCGDGPAPEGMLSYEELLAAHAPVEDTRTGGDRLAGVFYTGGTTGFPKGVMLTHDNIVSHHTVLVSTGLTTPGGTTLTATPMFHLAGVAPWNLQSMVGGTQVFVPSFEPVAVMEAIARHGCTTVMLVPAMVQMIVDHPKAGDYDLSSLKRLFYGAAPISEALLERAMRVLPKAGFVQGYGMTELSPVASLLDPDDHRNPALLRSAGRVIPGVQVRIADPADQDVPVGSVGEIVVRSSGAMRGYWGRPEETAAALRDGWMHTGDAGWMDENGYLYLVDRIKDMIVTGAENVYSAEVENAVATHPAVESCAVIGVPDRQWGERVHAVIVLKPGHTATEAEIREHCKTLIAGYKAPRTCEFVEILPMTATGKISKKDLRAPYWEDQARSVS
ncbi:long-chain-fatty-acid--CoA ligase [Streptomyces adustus]|uniref:long-chain-fatty-acid--CoA ligase n=1 Tax=Streptomyces adustus TaxID=1609272 RepID=UPI003714A123